MRPLIRIGDEQCKLDGILNMYTRVYVLLGGCCFIVLGQGIDFLV